MSGFVVPITMHWVWGGGWLETYLSKPFIDFSGSAVVHLTGGFCGLIGTFILGYKSENEKKNDAEGRHGNIPMMVTGILIL